ncbi:MAG: hypothetical protein ABIO70_05840 [Pseudomonadota bacterium]
MTNRLPLLCVLALGCTEYDLGRDKDPTPAGDDTGGVLDSGDPPVDTQDSTPPDDTWEPPIDETGLPPDAATEPVYAHTSSTLYSVDPEPPYVRTPIGAFSDGGPITDVTDIAIDTGGIMYAVSFDTLYRVDATNARLTRVSTPGPADMNALTFLADGTLLAGGGTALYQVDPASGTFNRISSIGSWSFAGDMVGLPDGLLYCAMSAGATSGETNLVVYDLASNTVLRTGATGTDSLYGMAYAEDTLFGFVADGSIYELDATTGAGHRILTGSEVWWGATTNPVEW